MNTELRSVEEIEEQLIILRGRLAELEEQKRNKEEIKQHPMLKLVSVVKEKRKNQRYPGPGAHRDRFTQYNQITNELSYLEPIMYVLNNIHERLEALEEVKEVK